MLRSARSSPPRPASPPLRRAKFWESIKNFPDRPEIKYPKLKLPRRLASLSSRKLGDLMSRYASLCGYFDELVARAEIDHAISQHNVLYLRSKLLLRAVGRTIAERKAHRSTRKELLAAKAEALKTRAEYVMLLTYRRNCDRYYQCVSREISRREAEHGRSRD